MMQLRAYAQHTFFALIFTAGGLAALIFPLPTAMRVALALAYFLVLGTIVGNALLREEPLFWRTYLGTLLFTAGVMIIGSAAYYLADLKTGTVALVLTAASAAVIGLASLCRRRAVTLSTPSPISPAPESKPRLRVVRVLFGLAAAASATGLLWYGVTVLQSAATDISIRSPWDVVPRMFFIIVLFAALGVLTMSVGGLAPRLALVPAAGLAALAVSVATLVYKVGFGFDPFIHRATELTIFRDGVINPKPLYYVGQYALVTVLARLGGGGVPAIDAWLVPAAFALVIPCAYWSLRKALRLGPSAAATAAVATLLLPLSSFAVTTPQGVANAIFLMTVFLALPVVTGTGFSLLGLFGLAGAAATIHPIAGVPLALFVTIVALLRLRDAKSGLLRHGAKVAVAVLAIAGAVALPAMFVVNAALSGAGVEVDVNVLRSPTAIIETLQTEQVETRQFSAIYDLVYSWKSARTAILALLAAVGLAYMWFTVRAGRVYAMAAAMLLANYVLLKSVVQFSFLISYERSNYADRLLELTVFAIAPMVAVAIAAVVQRAGKGPATPRVTLAVLLAALVTSSVYLAYPRRDKYENSRGWSTNGSDVEAVRLINENAGARQYVVLANQSVSAAAVREFGFPTYFPSRDPNNKNPIFYYPIPTGDPLYQIFLDVNEGLGRRASVEKAMDLTGVDTVYYVVSYYWWHAQEIILTAQREADEHWNVNGRDFVFKYVRK